MNESNNNSLLTDLKKFIVKQTQNAFDNENTGILLSQIGTLITKNVPQLRDSLGGRKLADFIMNEMADTIQIVHPPKDSKLKIALPATVQVNGDIMRFIPKPNATSTVDTPRYNSVFWAAFSQPLSEGYTRWIEFEPEIHFEDIQDEFLVTNTKKKVEAEFIINQTDAIEPKPQYIANKIKTWLLKNNVSLNRVIAQNVDAKLSGLHKKSLLEILIATLEEEDMKRIQIPLDVVAKLHRSKW
jgi:hypothetical protein